MWVFFGLAGAVGGDDTVELVLAEPDALDGRVDATDIDSRAVRDVDALLVELVDAMD